MNRKYKLRIFKGNYALGSTFCSQLCLYVKAGVLSSLIIILFIAAKEHPFRRKDIEKAKQKIDHQHLTARFLWLTKTFYKKEANTIYFTLKRKFPDSPEVHYMEAIRYLKSKNSVKAVASIKEGIAKRRDSARFWNLHGLLMSELEQYKAAYLSFKKAVMWEPYEPSYAYNLAVSLFNLQEFEKSLLTLQRASRLKGNFSDAYYLRGIIHSEQKRYADAIHYFALAHRYGKKSKQFLEDYLENSLMFLESGSSRESILEQSILSESTVVKLADVLQFRFNKHKEKTIRLLILARKRYGDYKKSIPLFGRLLRLGKAQIKDKKEYIFSLYQAGFHPPSYIRKMELRKNEKKILIEYWESVSSGRDRRDSFKVQDPVVYPLR